MTLRPAQPPPAMGQVAAMLATRLTPERRLGETLMDYEARVYAEHWALTHFREYLTRQAVHYTQREMARICGVDHSSISRMLSNTKRAPLLPFALKVIRGLGPLP